MFSLDSFPRQNETWETKKKKIITVKSFPALVSLQVHAIFLAVLDSGAGLEALLSVPLWPAEATCAEASPHFVSAAAVAEAAGQVYRMTFPPCRPHKQM